MLFFLFFFSQVKKTIDTVVRVAAAPDVAGMVRQLA
jgi:hypothetical protein